jgi:hypothetical protein
MCVPNQTIAKGFEVTVRLVLDFGYTPQVLAANHLLAVHSDGRVATNYGEGH